MKIPIRARIRTKNGEPAPLASVIIFAANRIRAASSMGEPLRLSAEEVRALDWAVIRVEGEQGDVADVGKWREVDFATASAPPR